MFMLPGQHGYSVMATASGCEPTYIGEMMQRLGIDPAGGVLPHFSLSYMTALHRCKACPARNTCRHWLDSTPMSVSFAPSFCPNADIFFELQFDRPGATRTFPVPPDRALDSSLGDSRLRPGRD